MAATRKAKRPLLLRIAGRLEYALSQTGMSKAALSKRSGVRLDAIGRLERAERLPEMLALQNLAKALGVPAGWLVFGEGPMPDLPPCLPEDADQRRAGNRKADLPKLAQ